MSLKYYFLKAGRLYEIQPSSFIINTRLGVGVMSSIGIFTHLARPASYHRNYSHARTCGVANPHANYRVVYPRWFGRGSD
jgi:hypothetical protein